MYGDSFGGVDLVDTGSVQLGNYYDNPEDHHYRSTRMWKQVIDRTPVSKV